MKRLACVLLLLAGCNNSVAPPEPGNRPFDQQQVAQMLRSDGSVLLASQQTATHTLFFTTNAEHYMCGSAQNQGANSTMSGGSVAMRADVAEEPFFLLSMNESNGQTMLVYVCLHINDPALQAQATTLRLEMLGGDPLILPLNGHQDLLFRFPDDATPLTYNAQLLDEDEQVLATGGE